MTTTSHHRSSGSGYFAIVLLAVTLLASALAGRQLFMDGASFVVQSLLDPTWYHQPTPRRFLAIMWTTAGPRLLGLVSPDAIVMGSFLFGLAAFAQIFIPVLVILRARLDDGLRWILLALFLSATVVLSNFVVTELLFLLGLTTIFVVLTLDPGGDPKGRLRVVLAVLLMASYEVVALTNILLAAGSAVHGRTERRSRSNKLSVILLLLAAPVFQVGFYLVNPAPRTGDELNRFVFLLIGAMGAALLTGLLGFRWLHRRGIPATPFIVLAFVVPVSLFFLPQAVGLRTRLFQWAYASRFYTVAVTILIAILPLLMAPLLRTVPRRVLDWFGERPLRDLAWAMLACFLGVGLLGSADSYLYRTRLEDAFTRHAGIVGIEACTFCLHPTEFGVPDLGYAWTWPLYSMAYTMKRHDQPSLIVLHPDGDASEITQARIEEFLRHEAGQHVTVSCTLPQGGTPKPASAKP